MYEIEGKDKPSTVSAAKSTLACRMHGVGIGISRKKPQNDSFGAIGRRLDDKPTEDQDNLKNHGNTEYARRSRRCIHCAFAICFSSRKIWRPFQCTVFNFKAISAGEVAVGIKALRAGILNKCFKV